MTYYNILSDEITIWDLNKFAKVTSYRRARSDFLWIVGAPNESLRLIMMYYTFKYSFGIKKIWLELLRSKKSPLKARFRQN